MPASALPPALQAVDLGPLAAIAPDELITNPSLLFGEPVAERAARALKYSRAGSDGSYDAIGFRLMAANPARGAVPLQTLHGARAERARDRVNLFTDPVNVVLDEEQKLRHRLMDLPDDSARFSYRIEGRLLQLELQSESGAGETWTFPLTAPLPLLRHGAVPADAPQLFTQKYRLDVAGSFWLPISTVIRVGRLRRFQDGRHEVAAETKPGHFYCFVSHRWLATTEPDPAGTQAAFLAWQIFSHLCDAIRVAQYRGLTQPRLRHLALGPIVGVAGGDLAEALLVNVLRPALDVATVAEAWKEVRSIASLIEHNGVVSAAGDTGLQRLRQTLDACPILAALMARIHVWYDYSCMPQPPRTPEDEVLFREGLQNLVAIQLLGHTVVLLDEAEDYLSRGWCTLEALVADSDAVSMELLIGSARKTAGDGTAEHYFQMLLQDRPHIVWRAVLDTEVLRVQTAEECVERLGLSVTDPRDLPFIYQQLRTLAAPVKIHVDPGELITGVYPVARTADGQIVVPAKHQRAVEEPRDDDSRQSLDWTGALRLARSRAIAASAETLEPYRALPRRTDQTPCHIAVVASCEGEGVLWATWSAGHREALEELLDADVRSVSWLAADIAPVGHFPCGAVRAVAIDAPLWVFVGTRMRLTHCDVTAGLLASVAAAGARVWSLTLDEANHNVTLIRGTTSPTRRVPAPDPKALGTIGGAFRSSLLKELFGESTPVNGGTDRTR